MPKKRGENKKKAEREYQGTYSARLELGCARRALWWSLAAAKELTTETHYNIGYSERGKRAQQGDN